jgi:hypothetical protein
VNRLDAEVFVSYMDVKPTASPTPSPCGSSEVGLVGRIDWAAATGVPVVLDATSKAVGQIDVVGPFSSTTLEIELVGTVAGKERPLGAAVTSPLSGPAGVFTFEITLSRALDGRKITDLHLITTVEDSSAPLPAFGLNSSSSFLNLPTIPEVNHG